MLKKIWTRYHEDGFRRAKREFIASCEEKLLRENDEQEKKALSEQILSVAQDYLERIEQDEYDYKQGFVLQKPRISERSYIERVIKKYKNESILDGLVFWTINFELGYRSEARHFISIYEELLANNNTDAQQKQMIKSELIEMCKSIREQDIDDEEDYFLKMLLYTYDGEEV